jgi:hypothetical protein
LADAENAQPGTSATTTMDMMKESTAESSISSAAADWGGFLATVGPEDLGAVSAKGAGGCSMLAT